MSSDDLSTLARQVLHMYVTRHGDITRPDIELAEIESGNRELFRAGLVEPDGAPESNGWQRYKLADAGRTRAATKS